MSEDYVRLAWRVVNDNLTAEEIDQRIGAIGASYPIGAAIDALREGNCYEGWESELRYLMFRYEEHLAKSQNQNFSMNNGTRFGWRVLLSPLSTSGLAAKLQNANATVSESGSPCSQAEF